MAKQVLTPEDAARGAKEAADRVRKRKTTPDQNPVQEKLKNVAARKEEPKVKLTKEEKAIKKAKEAVEKAEQKLKEAKQKLEEAKRLNKTKEEIQKRTQAVRKAEAALKKAKEKLRKARGEKPMDLRQAGQKAKNNTEKRKKAGMNDKHGNGKDTRNSNTKLASHINLPSGMRIRQDGPDYVLVTTDKAGNEHTTPVTDVMNQIDKYNKGVDAQNAAAKAQSAVKPIQPQNGSVPANRTTVNVPEKNIPPTPTPALPTVSDNELKGAENIASVSGKIKPDDVREFAETAMQLSKSGLLKDPHALEKLNERKRRQEQKTDARNRQMVEKIER